ncbi:MAG TPA: methyltransferase domain-containing protein [Acidimicrobiales bacterium]|jgi:SAM-dependent methyltransferase|nr:methyltransferase domain-containing protein [Acidimicrobiales bacterium]
MTPGPRALCPVCGVSSVHEFRPVLWDALIREWELSEEETRRIDHREGQSCSSCGASVRSMALTRALLGAAGFDGSLDDWVASQPALHVLEINKAGDLTPWLDRLPGHLLVEFPEIDIQTLPFDSGRWDIVIHSDTLEHVDDPGLALAECRRVLGPEGALCFTIPVIPGRMSRRRDDMPPSYHGTEEDPIYRVVTEYGADFWLPVLEAGFTDLRLVADYGPHAVALVARDRPRSLR